MIRPLLILAVGVGPSVGELAPIGDLPIRHPCYDRTEFTAWAGTEPQSLGFQGRAELLGYHRNGGIILMVVVQDGVVCTIFDGNETGVGA